MSRQRSSSPDLEEIKERYPYAWGGKREVSDSFVYGGQYPSARGAAFARSDGVCQFCGSEDAREAHHWALEYPPGFMVEGKDLTALCIPCHNIATTIRRLVKQGVKREVLHHEFSEADAERKAWQKELRWFRLKKVRNTIARQRFNQIWMGLVIVVESYMIWFYHMR